MPIRVPSFRFTLAVLSSRFLPLCILCLFLVTIDKVGFYITCLRLLSLVVCLIESRGSRLHAPLFVYLVATALQREVYTCDHESERWG